VGSTDQERTTHDNRQSVCDSNVATRSGGKASPTCLGTKVKSDATLIRVETDNGLTGIGAALGTPPIVAAIVEHELAAECVGEDPLFSERIYEKMYSGSRSRPALDMMPVAVTCGKCRVQTGKPRKASFVLRGTGGSNPLCYASESCSAVPFLADLPHDGDGKPVTRASRPRSAKGRPPRIGRGNRSFGDDG